MRTAILIMTMCAMAACMDSPDRTAASEQSLFCDPDCDPGSQAYLINLVGQEGQHLGQQLPSSMLCHYYSGGCYPDIDGGPDICTPAHNECSAIYADPWGQFYVAGCSGAANPPCDHRACGRQDIDPSQYACR